MSGFLRFDHPISQGAIFFIWQSDNRMISLHRNPVTEVGGIRIPKMSGFAVFFDLLLQLRYGSFCFLCLDFFHSYRAASGLPDPALS